MSKPSNAMQVDRHQAAGAVDADGDTGMTDGSAASSMEFSPVRQLAETGERGHAGEDEDDSAASSFEFDDGEDEQNEGANLAQDADDANKGDEHANSNSGMPPEDEDSDDGNRADSSGLESDDDDGGVNKGRGPQGDESFFPVSQPSLNSSRAGSSPPAADAASSSAASSISFDQDVGDGGEEEMAPAQRKGSPPANPAQGPTLPAHRRSLTIPAATAYLPSYAQRTSRAAMYYFDAAAQSAQTQMIHSGERLQRRLKGRYQAQRTADQREREKMAKRNKKRAVIAQDDGCDGEVEEEDAWIPPKLRKMAQRHEFKNEHSKSRIRWEQCTVDQHDTSAILQEAIRWKSVAARTKP